MPGGYPWPAPLPMSAMPPMGIRPPMMLGPPPTAYPPGSFKQPPRLPFSMAQDTSGTEHSQESGADGDTGKPAAFGGGGDSNAEESQQRDGGNAADVALLGNFPRPMGHGDWHMRGPVPLLRAPNVPRPDLMRGPRSFPGEISGRRGLLGAPPSRFDMPQNFPHLEEEEEEEEYYDEFGEEGHEEEEHDEESEEFPFDGNNHFICFSYALFIDGCFSADILITCSHR